jgi:NADH-quinone oxidoreductase subunit A
MLEDYVFNYTAVLVAGGFGFVGIGLTFVLSWLLAPRRSTPLSEIVYECGIIPTGDGRSQYNLRYYLFALFFLIFAVETVFLFPWALVFLKLPGYVFYEMLVFLAILFFGLVYAWRKGVLQWR